MAPARGAGGRDSRRRVRLVLVVFATAGPDRWAGLTGAEGVVDGGDEGLPGAAVGGVGAGRGAGGAGTGAVTGRPDQYDVFASAPAHENEKWTWF